jgi:hypothetical protein
MLGRSPGIVDRTEREQAPPRFLDRGGGRRVDPLELAWIGDSPDGAVEREGAEIRFQYLRLVEARQACRGGLFP